MRYGFRNSTTRYGIIAMLLHWSMACLIIYMLYLGLTMTSTALSPKKMQQYGLHKSLGVLVLGLAAIRLVWKLLNPAPILPQGMKKLEKLAAHLGHAALYGCMFALPLSGWLLSSTAGFPVSFFGLFTLPNLIAPSPEQHHFFAEAHELIAFGLMGLISLHALAALLHHFKHKDNVLRRMLPLVLLGMVFLPAIAKAEASITPWNIVKEQSSLSFTATQNNAPVTGKFTDFTGEILFDKALLEQSRVSILVNVAAIEATLAEVSATLTTPDWFNAALFPQARFEATQFKQADNGDFTATGTLTLRDKTLPVTLTFQFIDYSDTKAEAKGSTILKRTAFGIGQGAWADTGSVKDDVLLEFHLVATR